MLCAARQALHNKESEEKVGRLQEAELNKKHAGNSGPKARSLSPWLAVMN